MGSGSAAAPAAGMRLAGRYLLLDRLGRGGMGVVWRARDELLDREVAIKDLLLPASVTAAERTRVRDRVLGEARAAARFSHPGAVVLHDVLVHDGRPLLVMELVDAPSLHELVEREGPLPPGRVARLGLGLLDTLDAAHRQGVVHLDVTPANVLVLADGGAKLADFGIAAAQDAPARDGGTVLGSPAYMAPEQVAGEWVGPAADLWALAATLYFAVEGMPPFGQGEPRETLATVVAGPPRPPRQAGPLGPALIGVLAKQPARRPGPARLHQQLGPLGETEATALLGDLRAPCRVDSLPLSEEDYRAWGAGHGTDGKGAPPMDHAIWAEGLVKRFGETTALAGVDLTVRTGTVLGLLGPNGAGKTTAVRILATLLQPDAGRATVGGYDVVGDAHRVRQLIGLTGQYASVDEGLTGTENLLLIGRLLGMPRRQAKQRARDLLARFDLVDAADRAAKTYSGGMRRRLDLAASLVGRPRLLYLDEPTSGLDPRSRLELWDLVRGLVADGVTVLLTTQYLEEADELADEIAVIDHGRVIATGTPEELKAKTGAQSLAVRPADEADLATVAALVGELAEVAPEVDGHLVTVPVVDSALLPAAVRRLDDAGIVISELALRGSSLNEVFLSLTGRPAEETDETDQTDDVKGVPA